MVLHPGVFKKAREELDRVVGQDRLPNFSDQDTLPYIAAVVKESLRWNPVAPFGDSQFRYSPICLMLMIDEQLLRIDLWSMIYTMESTCRLDLSFLETHGSQLLAAIYLALLNLFYQGHTTRRERVSQPNNFQSRSLSKGRKAQSKRPSS